MYYITNKHFGGCGEHMVGLVRAHLFIFAVLLLFNLSFSATIYVNQTNGAGCGVSGSYYSSIQAAINAASDGDTIIVCNESSPYVENVAVNKSLNVYGNESGVVVASPDASNTISITADYVNITNLTAEGATHIGRGGFYVTGNNVTISYSVAQNNYNGFYISSKHSKFTNNVAYNNAYGGFYVYNSFNDTLRNNTLLDNPVGYYISGSNDNLYENNRIDSVFGMTVYYSSSNNTISNNNITSQTQQGISIDSSANYNNIRNNHITSNATYTVSINGYGNILQNNTIINTKNLGTAAYIVGNNTLINNTMQTTGSQQSSISTYGTVLVSGGYGKIYNNTILGHVYAIYILGDAQNTTIENNTIRDFDNGIIDSKGYIFIEEPSQPSSTAYNERNLNINNNVFLNNSGANMIRTPQTLSSSLKGFYNINITNNRFIDLQGDFNNGAIWLDSTSGASEPIFQNIIIKNNYFDNVSFGIWFQGSMENILIENNTITNTYNSGTGIVCFTNRVCKNVTFKENTIINDTSDYGAINPWNFAENVTITNNAIYNCKYGINLYHPIGYDTYFRNVNITGNLLSGIGETGISVFNGTNVLIENNSISGGSANGAGVLLNLSSDDTVTNNTIRDTVYGIYLDSSSNNILTNNRAYNNFQYGFYLSSSSNNILTSNTGDGNSISAIYLFSSSNNTISNNKAVNNFKYGIHLDSSSNNTLTSNTGDGNSVIGIYLSSSHNNTLTNNSASKGILTGFSIYLSSNNIFTNNFACDNGASGIYLDSSSNNTFTNNSACNNGYSGVYLGSSSNNILTNNIAHNNNQHGFYFSSSSNNALQDNSAYNNGDSGIYLLSSLYNVLVNNTVFGNKNVGFSFTSSNSNNLTNNSAYNTAIGFYFSGSYSNRLSDNLAYENSGHGFELFSSNYNILINNTAYNNSQNGFHLSTSSFTALINNTAYNMHLAAFYILSSASSNLTGNIAYKNDEDGFIISSSSLINLSNNIAHDNKKHGVSAQSSASVTLANNTLYNNGVGLSLYYSNNAYVYHDHYYNNSDSLFYARADKSPINYSIAGVIFDNPAGNYQDYTTLSIVDELEASTFIYIYDDTIPSSLPSNKVSFAGKYLNISPNSPMVVDSITWHWTDSEAAGHDENSFELWKYNGTWVLLNDTPNTADNTLSLANFSSFSGFAILETPSAQPPGGDGGGGGGCSREVNISYNFDCKTDLLTITLMDDHERPVKEKRVRITSVNGRVYLTTNSSGMVEYQLPTTLEPVAYTITFGETGIYCKAQKSFEYVSCPPSEQPSERGCTEDDDCASNEYCYVPAGQEIGACKEVECACGEVLNHACYAYDCCADSDCEEGQYCDITSHTCKEKEECTDDSCCAEDEYYNTVTESCESIALGDCGYISNHRWYDYECCADSDCEGDYSIITNTTGFVNEEHNFTVEGPSCSLSTHTCSYGPLANERVRVKDPLGDIKTVYTSDEGEGKFLPEHEGEYILMLTKENVYVNATVVSKQKESNMCYLLPLLLLILLIAYLLYFLYKRKARKSHGNHKSSRKHHKRK